MTFTHILVDFENTQPKAADVALVQGAGLKLWIFRGPGQKKYEAEFAEALLALGDRVGIVRCQKSGRNALDMHIAFQMGRLVGELARAAAPADTAFVVVSRDTDYDPLLQHLRAEGFRADRVASIKAALGGAPGGKGAGKGKERKIPAKEADTPAPRAARTAAKTAKAKPDEQPPLKKAGGGSKAEKAGKSDKPAKAGKAEKARKAGRVETAPRAQEAPAPARPAAAALSIDEAADRIVGHFRDKPTSRPVRLGALQAWIASHLRGRLAETDVPAVVAALEQRGVVQIDGKKVGYPGAEDATA